MSKIFSKLMLALVVAACGMAASALDVTISVSSESFLVNSPVTFTAEVSGSNPQTVYTWSFDDNTGNFVVTGNPSIVHTFKSEEIFAVSVTVNNGVDQPGTDFIVVEGVRGPAETDPPGIDASDPALKTVTNPDDGVSFSVDVSKGGFVAGTVSSTTPAVEARASNSFVTDFGDGINGRSGSALQHRYAEGGVYVLTVVRNENGSETGRVRKTLSFSIGEIDGVNSDPNVIDPPVNQRKLVFQAIKGKFSFKKGTPDVAGERAVAKVKKDTVTVSWDMTLPQGFDINTQNIDLAIGNVVDSIPLDKSGKGGIIQPSPYKSVRFKFPRLKKGESRSATPFPSRVTVQMSAEDLSGSGFDTEGITPREHIKTQSKLPMARKVQVATTIAGVAFAGVADVNLVVNKDDSFGSISSRK